MIQGRPQRGAIMSPKAHEVSVSDTRFTFCKLVAQTCILLIAVIDASAGVVQRLCGAMKCFFLGDGFKYALHVSSQVVEV